MKKDNVILYIAMSLDGYIARADGAPAQALRSDCGTEIYIEKRR